MDAKELRTFSVDELKGRIRQWQEELFRNRFKAGTTETKDTSIFVKTRRDVARAYTILREKELGLKGPVAEPQSAAPQDKPTAKKAASEKKDSKSVKRKAKASDE